ncbi:FUSC family protein [Methylobacterium currus]|uniref:FUSC family protein n=1 Tax=Methylobacterium currus TaxID=2051553 RepID=A0A2R4WPC4_9HYPH|nr:FUSC family protein [Methylobacterium currus]AWB23406.1 FUSC family protein [Methylobacterium currus]UHC16952.1 FUSC family protein [Methylobacterium currus]
MKPFPIRRGTLREPGPDLARLPVAPDLTGISIAEGLRAAVAFASIVLLEWWLAWPPLLTMALAANLTCFCDIGGPIRPRLRALLAFAGLGGLFWGAFGVMEGYGPALVLPVALVVIFGCTFARVWGVPAQTVGNVLVVVLCLALDRALSVEQGAVVAAMFWAGGLWAAFLALVVWRLHPYRPAHTAIGGVWRGLSRLARDLRRLSAGPHGSADLAVWEAHARGHRRAVRDAIETARTLVLDLARSRARLSERNARALIRLEAAEQLFGVMIALSDYLERATPAQRADAARLLRLLPPTLKILSRAIRRDRPVDLRRIERALARAKPTADADPAYRRMAERILDRVRIGAKLSGPEDLAGGGGLAGAPAPPWRETVLQPLRANLTWSSANLRHAVRATVVALPALAVTFWWPGPFTHWLTITVVLTMQPFYAATWQRALERIGGTVLGGVIGAVLAFYATSPPILAAMMVPLSVLGFAARGVSYGTFIACLTPLVVVLVELVEPGHSSWEIVGMRALFTVLGGAVAVLAGLLLWPLWEPGRVRDALRTALQTHARYAEAVVAERLGEGPSAAAEAAARAAGLASNNLEAALSRALQEPRQRGRSRIEAAMVADATLRRMAGRLAILRHEPEPEGPDAAAWRAWRDWLNQALARTAAGERLPSKPEGADSEAFGRIAAQVELLAGTLKRAGIGGVTPP